jgi:hypothetical protein
VKIGVIRGKVFNDYCPENVFRLADNHINRGLFFYQITKLTNNQKLQLNLPIDLLV